MSDSGKLSRLIDKLEDGLDRLRFRMNKRLGLYGPVMVEPYMAYGTKQYVRCLGRVFTDKNIISDVDDSKLRNLLNIYKRFESDELANVQLEIKIGQNTFSLKTDEEGFYHLDTNLTKNIRPADGIAKIKVNVRDCELDFEKPLIKEGEILIPGKTAKMGIISDIDDTIIQTNVVSTVKMVYTTILSNAYNRIVFEGASQWYNGLQKGGDGQQKNPVFYVSNSPWNLYDMLLDIFSINKLPKGPILLRDFGTQSPEKVVKYKQHKYNTALHILKTYPHLPFILIGDAGEKDADIYLQLALSFPKRIKKIYIRKVADEKRNYRVQKLIDKQDEIDMILFEHTEEAMKDACERGWVN